MIAQRTNYNALDIKLHHQLTALTERLVNTILVDQLYFSRYEYQGIHHQEFIKKL